MHPSAPKKQTHPNYCGLRRWSALFNVNPKFEPIVWRLQSLVLLRRGATVSLLSGLSIARGDGFQ